MRHAFEARGRAALAIITATLALLLAAASARAASLQVVSNWATSGLPSDVSMYIYVPDRRATNAPVLTLIHYCGGTASAVFGQAQGGGLVSAADQYGFLIVVPSSGRCWDVQSNKTWTRDGGGDSHAIRQMVRHAIASYNGNADRVYATGDSSGGMMTELLLALYPEVFKAGAAFAGMPAACRGANESGSGGGYSGACAGGSVTHSAQEWGDIARMLAPGHVGHRPRVQLFHGDGDTIIRYANHTEAIKQWTNVLGLATAPTSSEAGVRLGTHQATRQRWQNSCGHVVLDAFTSLGGDHGPSDALFPAQYVIPFLGLDKTGAVDPEVEQCGGGADGGADAGARGGAGGGGGGIGGGAGGAGARGGGGGAGASGGAGGARDGGVDGSGDAATGVGGSAAGTGGAGPSGSGGAAGAGRGGSGGNGGGPGLGGSGSGGASAAGGAVGNAGGSAGGAGGGGGTSQAGGGGNAGGAGFAGAGAGSGSGACNCAVGAAATDQVYAGAAAALAVVLSAFIRRRRARPARPTTGTG
jgi:poly(hydroxyalkanoate) depolymerase family esterase